MAKKSRPRHKQRSKAIKRQLQYIKRNLSHIQGIRGCFKSRSELQIIQVA
ncbi:hypothetical protein RintRC_3544 [Richelia intracellularis]|nr:hypothetical protein RintRC_3544 [Richelia intracellularis]